MISVKGKTLKKGSSFYNLGEYYELQEKLEKAIGIGIENIGVISPYKGQVI